MNPVNPIEKQSMIFGNVEEPNINKIIDSDDIFCNGWFFSENGIKSIFFYLNNHKIGNTTTGIKRPDLKIAYPHLQDIELSGFVFYTNIFMDDGKNSLLIHVVANTGEELWIHREITVNKDISSIDRINIELTNQCNLACRWCAGTGERSQGYMDYDVFTSIFDQLRSGRVIVHEVHLYNVGESLLHPHFRKFIEYLGNLSNKPQTVLVTNATLLSDELIEAIITSKGIDMIQFSIDGGTKESYEWLRRGAHWENTLKNIECFLERNDGSVKTGLITIDINERFSDEFETLIKIVDFFDFRPPHNWTGQEKLTDSPIDSDINPHPCWHIRNNLVILWNGDITLCCADLHGRGVVGNIKSDDIADLWKNERLRIYRQQQGRKKEIDLCKKCSIG